VTVFITVKNSSTSAGNSYCTVKNLCCSCRFTHFACCYVIKWLF